MEKNPTAENAVAQADGEWIAPVVRRRLTGQSAGWLIGGFLAFSTLALLIHEEANRNRFRQDALTQCRVVARELGWDVTGSMTHIYQGKWVPIVLTLKAGTALLRCTKDAKTGLPGCEIIGSVRHGKVVLP